MRLRARGRPRPSAGMNRLETASELVLRARQQAGEVAWYRYEGIKLRLADKTFYTPDFAVMLADGSLEMHETKGYWEDDARVKIKIAAETYPFRFVGIRRVKGAWEIEEF